MRPLRLRLGAGLGKAELERIAAGDYSLVGAGEEADLLLSATGEKAARGAAGEEAAGRAPDPRPRARPLLGAREAEILGFLAEGWSNEEIASILGIGRRTVRFHLERLYAKLGVSRRGEAVAEGFRRGFLSLDF